MKQTAHGSLLEVCGIGVLLQGQSGIGKSECALQLIMRGHPLIADDVVELTKNGDVVEGSSPEIVRNLLEIRGLGIINIRDLFGVIAVRDKQKIDLVIELVEWQNNMSVDRTGIDDRFLELLGVKIPYLVLPVRLGRDIGSIVEVAARNELLHRAGIHTAVSLEKRMEQMLLKNRQLENK